MIINISLFFDRWTRLHRQRHRDGQTEAETERQRDRHRETDTERQTQRDRLFFTSFLRPKTGAFRQQMSDTQYVKFHPLFT